MSVIGGSFDNNVAEGISIINTVDCSVIGLGLTLMAQTLDRQLEVQAALSGCRGGNCHFGHIPRYRAGPMAKSVLKQRSELIEMLDNLG